MIHISLAISRINLPLTPSAPHPPHRTALMRLKKNQQGRILAADVTGQLFPLQNCAKCANVGQGLCDGKLTEVALLKGNETFCLVAGRDLVVGLAVGLVVAGRDFVMKWVYKQRHGKYKMSIITTSNPSQKILFIRGEYLFEVIGLPPPPPSPPPQAPWPPGTPSRPHPPLPTPTMKFTATL
jgi:hypothetical protein